MSVKFSIIVPAYNEEKLLPKCLESLVSLDYDKKDFEIILVNNNSRDRTREIASSFPGVKVFDEPKQGYVFALINGCRKASGEILVFADADIEAPSDWLKKYAAVYQNETVVVAGGPGKLRPISMTTVMVEVLSGIAGLTFGVTYGFNLSIRKKVYDEIRGFNPRINFNSDTDLILRAKKIGRAKYLVSNPVITSSRRYKNPGKALVYGSKGLINTITLMSLKKAPFFDFGDIRE